MKIKYNTKELLFLRRKLKIIADPNRTLVYKKIIKNIKIIKFLKKYYSLRRRFYNFRQFYFQKKRASFYFEVNKAFPKVWDFFHTNYHNVYAVWKWRAWRRYMYMKHTFWGEYWINFKMFVIVTIYYFYVFHFYIGIIIYIYVGYIDILAFILSLHYLLFIH